MCSKPSPFWVKEVIATFTFLARQLISRSPMMMPTPSPAGAPAWVVSLATSLVQNVADRYVSSPKNMEFILRTVQAQVAAWCLQPDFDRDYDLVEVFCGAAGTSNEVEKRGGKVIRFDRWPSELIQHLIHPPTHPPHPPPPPHTHTHTHNTHKVR